MDEPTKAKWFWRPNYLGFTIGCVIAWAIIWICIAVFASTLSIHRLAYVFLGFAIGFFVAALGRLVYPPPRRTLIGMKGR
jgi:uncharacterized membrane protein